MTKICNGQPGFQAGRATQVWYHANCADGFAAAWVAWQKLGDQSRYIPVRHGDPPPAVQPEDHLAIVDFSYSRALLEDLRTKVQELVVLDHHSSAAVELEGLPYAHFDLQKSGARMAWEYWHPEAAVPRIVEYVEDRDLWRWALPQSKEVSLALSLVPFDFELWNQLDVEELKIKGGALCDYQENLVDRAVTRAHWTELEGYRIPVVNSCLFQSEIGDRLCQEYTEAPFAGVYYDKESSQAWSLRSVGDFDVSKVASAFGGGGHRNAAGFALPKREPAAVTESCSWTP